MSSPLEPYNINGIRVEAWNEKDATFKNNTLAATTAENMVVPSSTGRTTAIVFLVADQDIWYNLDATASEPSDDSTNHRFLPAGERRGINLMGGVTNISLYSNSVAHVVGEFYFQ